MNYTNNKFTSAHFLQEQRKKKLFCHNAKPPSENAEINFVEILLRISLHFPHEHNFRNNSKKMLLDIEATSNQF